MNSLSIKRLFFCLLVSLATSVGQAAQIEIINRDAPGEGFNDGARRAPAGGNPGTTLGQQRLNALRFAANLLGARVASNVVIEIEAEFNPDQCSPTNATLATAGATRLVADVPNQPRANTFYPVALANALAGRDLEPNRADISASFNSSIDNGLFCLGGADWYYGYDNNPPGRDLDFISTATHELIHGLGFATFAELSNGEFVDNTPDIFSRFIRDLSRGATWPQLTARQRAQSATNDGNLVWDGPSTNSRAAPMLNNGTNQGRIQLFAPFPLQPGSSVSHWDTRVTPNALMEPFDTADVTVAQGIGLASCLLQDIGWTLINNTRCPDSGGVSQPPDPAEDVPDFNEGEPSAPSSNPATGDTSNAGGGGGCTLAGGALDPLFPLLIFIALLLLRRRCL